MQFCRRALGLAVGLTWTLATLAGPRAPRLPPPAPSARSRPARSSPDELAQQEGWDAAALREQLSQTRLPRVRQ